MKILFSSKSPLAGVCELMARCINLYYPGIHEARVLNAGARRHRWYCRPADPQEKGVADSSPLVPRYDVNNQAHVDECLEWADVIHCMANVGVNFFKRDDLLDKKLWVYQWHGAQVWSFDRVFSPRHFKKVRWIHIGQGWIESSKRQADFFRPFFEKFGAKVVPNVITADDPLHMPMPWDERKPKVCFSPSNRNDNAVNGKGIAVVEKSWKGVQRDLIAGVNFEECLRRKRDAHLGIDEVSSPMYHRSGLEFLSQGVPCICSYSAEAERLLKDATGAFEMPFIQCPRNDPKALRSRIRAHLGLPDRERWSLSVQARAWIETYYHPRMIIQRHVDIYEGKS